MVLSYAIEPGRFLVKLDDGDQKTCTLMFQATQDQALKLGVFRSFQEALAAVLNQETGLASWDALEPEAIPARIHDISQWKLEESEELG